LAFFYVGITQASGTGMALLPVGVICWIACYGGWSHQLLIRLPLTLGVWGIVSEALSQLQSRVGQLTAALEKLASTDPLTGLASRRMLAVGLDSLAPGDAIVFIDMDDFKAINDRHGHSAGDQVLTDMGATVRQVLRSEDLAVRYGGEELLLVLRGSGAHGALTTLDRLSDEWAAIHSEVTFSAGISVVSATTDSTSVMQSADKALYAAKAAGRDCWRLATDDAAVLFPASAEVTSDPEGTTSTLATDLVDQA